MAQAYEATPHQQLIDEIMDSRIAKNEREHAAAREIAALRSDLDAAILAERERCAGVCRELNGYPTSRLEKDRGFEEGWKKALDLAEQKIKEG